MLTDLFDLNFGKWLTVTHVAAVAHLALELNHRDLVGATVRDDRDLTRATRHERRAHLHLLSRFIGDHQTIEREAGARFEIELFDLELLALGDEVLLAAGCNDCVHNDGKLAAQAPQRGLFGLTQAGFFTAVSLSVLRRDVKIDRQGMPDLEVHFLRTTSRNLDNHVHEQGITIQGNGLRIPLWGRHSAVDGDNLIITDPNDIEGELHALHGKRADRVVVKGKEHAIGRQTAKAFPGKSACAFHGAICQAERIGFCATHLCRGPGATARHPKDETGKYDEERGDQGVAERLTRDVHRKSESRNTIARATSFCQLTRSRLVSPKVNAMPA